MGDPLEIVVRKDFFVDLKLPDSAVRGEQLEIKAVIHNHGPNLYTVSLVHSSTIIMFHPVNNSQQFIIIVIIQLTVHQ